MNKLSTVFKPSVLRRISAGVISNRSYVPIKLASEVIIPKSGENKNLSPIVYHHALTGSKELWLDVPQIIADATRRLSYTFDARCHGDSEWTDDFTTEANIEDLRHFMESMNLKKAVLVGHSIGGRVISLFALKYPHMVDMIINEDGALDDEVIKKIQKRVLSYIDLWAEGVKSAPVSLTETEAVKHAFDYVYGKFPSTGEGLEEKEYLYKLKYPIRRTESGYDVKHNMEAIRKYLNESMDGKDDRKLDGLYNGPGLFMMAKNSNFRERMDSAEIKRKFPNVELQILEGVTHNIHLRYPERFIESFLTFYKKHCFLPDA